MRNFKAFNLESFRHDVLACNLSDSMEKCEGMEESWDGWSTEVLGVMNQYAPLKQYRLKARSNPWITREIVPLMYKRDYL